MTPYFLFCAGIAFRLLFDKTAFLVIFLALEAASFGYFLLNRFERKKAIVFSLTLLLFLLAGLRCDFPPLILEIPDLRLNIYPLRHILPPEEAGLAEGLLLGEEEGISSSLKQSFNDAGIRHLTAVSGMNIVMAGSLVFSFLISLGFWRQKCLIISFLFVVIYVLVVGAPVSAIRAGIMGGLAILAKASGRISNPKRLFLFSLSLMLFFDPWILFDIGFQLSFCATFGLIFLNLKLKKIPSIFGLRENLSSTISCQIATFPITVLSFSQIPVLGIAANLLVLPLVPLATILSFLFFLGGVFFSEWAVFFSLPLLLLLRVIIKIARFFSALPLANVLFGRPQLILILPLYLLIVFIILKKNNFTSFRV